MPETLLPSLAVKRSESSLLDKNPLLSTISTNESEKPDRDKHRISQSLRTSTLTDVRSEMPDRDKHKRIA